MEKEETTDLIDDESDENREIRDRDPRFRVMYLPFEFVIT